MTANFYPWIKALHVTCAMLFVSGLICASLLLHFARTSPDGAAARALAFRRWDSRVTTPAMIGVWAFGIVMAQSAGWFADGWLQAKLGIVFFLSAVHGMQSGRLRRAGATIGPKPGMNWLPMILVSVTAIVVLAVVKP